MVTTWQLGAPWDAGSMSIVASPRNLKFVWYSTVRWPLLDSWRALLARAAIREEGYPCL